MKNLFDLLKKKKTLIIFTLLKLTNAFIALFTNMFIIRKISVEEFGTYSIILTVIGFLTTFGFSWSSAAITYYGAREKAKKGNMNKTFWSRNYILLGSFTIVLFIFTVFGKQVENYIGLRINSLLILWLMIKIGIDGLNTYFLATKKQVVSALILVIGRVMFLFPAIILRYSIKELVVINILCDLTGLIYIAKIDKNDIGRPTFDKENFKEVLNFGLWQLFGFSGLYLINFGDNFIIRYFLTLEDVAIYNAAYKLFNAVASLSFLFSSYYAPEVVEAFEQEEGKELKKVFYQDRILLTLLLLVPHLIVIIFSRPIINLIYGVNYLGAAKVLRVLMVGSFFRFATTFNRLVYNSLKKHKILQCWNILQMLINLILGITLVPKIGVIGAAIATTTAIVIISIINTIWVEKTLKLYIDRR